MWRLSLGSWKVQNDKMLKFVGNVGTDKVLRSLCAVTLKNLSVWHVVLVASSCFHADWFDSCRAWMWSKVKHSDWERCWKELQTQAIVDFFESLVAWKVSPFLLFKVLGQNNSPTISMLLKQDIPSESFSSQSSHHYNYEETSVVTHPGSSCWFQMGRYFPASPPWGL